MPFQSDVTVNYTKFDPSSISPATSKLNVKLQNIMAGIPKWYEVCTLLIYLLHLIPCISPLDAGLRTTGTRRNKRPPMDLKHGINVDLYRSAPPNIGH